MSANLEDLSNDELRVRLLEYGFENLPVTQTTRKVLIKKLKNAIDTQKTKNRRETVAVIKSSDDEDIPEARKKRERTPNRRATIAVTEKSKRSSVSSSNGTSSSTVSSRDDTPSKSSSRRSSRATPSKDPKPVVSSTNIPVLQEDSDDDVVEVPVINRRSKSKTPLTASEIVRTAYKSTVETVSENIGEDISNSTYKEFLPAPKDSMATRRRTFANSTVNYSEQPIRVDTPTKLRKTTITTSFNPSGSYNFKEQQNDEALDLDEATTPYLSNFAKRLSTLKAEPLDSGMKKYKSLSEDYEKPSTSYGYNYKYSQPYPTQSSSRGVVKEMTRNFETLDKKYSVRKYVYIALLIMIIVAIYVILFM